MLEVTRLDHKQRVSCAALCRIRDEQGRYLLGLNADRRAQGIEIYMPIGGALRWLDLTPLASFAAVPENAETHDLRLFIDPARIDRFRAWFLTRSGRETSPFRELREELVEEFAVLASLRPTDVRMDFAGIYEAEAITGRGASVGAPTRYFHDIFDVTFLIPAHRDALDAVSGETGLRWFDEAELRRGDTADHARLDGRALLL